MAEFKPALLVKEKTVLTKLDSIICYNDGEALGTSEPYLWAIYFKLGGNKLNAVIDIDKENVKDAISTGKLKEFIKLVGNSYKFSLAEISEEGSTIDGSAEIYSPSGSLSSLNDWRPTSGGLIPGVRESDPDTLNVPSNVGEYEDLLKPIPLNFDKLNESFEFIFNSIWDSFLYELNESIPYDLDLEEIANSIIDDSCKKSFSEMPKLGLNFLFNEVIGGVPPMTGVVYILMERDSFEEIVAERGRTIVVDELDTLLSSIIAKLNYEITTKEGKSALRKTIEEGVKNIPDTLKSQILEEFGPTDERSGWDVFRSGDFKILNALFDDHDDPLATLVEFRVLLADAIIETNDIKINDDEFEETIVINGGKISSFKNNGVGTKFISNVVTTNDDGEESKVYHGTWELKGKFELATS